MTPFTSFHAPATVEEAVGILAETGPATRVVAGGTDVMVRVRRGLVPESETALLSVHRIASMRGVAIEGDEVVIGAATTAADLIEDATVREHAPILGVVADRLASAQIRALATVGGNLANASPAGDLINPLLLLDARLTLASAGCTRTMAVDGFITGPGQTRLLPGELLVDLRFRAPTPERVFRFRKAGRRPAMECSVVTAGLAFTPRDRALTDVRLAFGSVAPTPLRGRETERALEGRALTPEVVEAAARTAHDEVSPISDIRGSADYRRALVAEFVRRLLDDG
jgi:CO/xanthine dehydrogenase FAD-binding subunit